jgi:hypothetical protein
MAASCRTALEHYQEIGNCAKQYDYLTRMTKDENFIVNWCPNMPTALKCNMKYWFTAH